MGPQDALARLAANRPVDAGPIAGVRGPARWHGLSGLLAREVEAGRVTLSDDETAGVLADWRAERLWSATLDLELKRIAHGGRGLSPPILLKGPAVARRYADPTVRNYVDIDLLVPPEDLPAWTNVLGEHGFDPPSRLELRMAGYKHQLSMRRSLGERNVTCEVHRCLFVERTAMLVDHAALLPYARLGPIRHLLELDDRAQLLVLALHLAHHQRETRRLIWSRDIVEIAREDMVEAARALAGAFGVSWALEGALFQTESLLGRSVWGAKPEPLPLLGMAKVKETAGAASMRHLAIGRELGWRHWPGYLGGVLDPRRFKRASGAGVDTRAWLKFVFRGVGRVSLGLFRKADRKPTPESPSAQASSGSGEA